MAYLCADRIAAADDITITATAQYPVSLKAPLKVVFSAVGTTSPLFTSRPFEDLYYVWNFDDAGSGTFTRGRQTGISKNVAYGGAAAHVYESAGTYTPTLTVFNGTGQKTYTFADIVVTAFPADANTIAYASGAAPVAGVDGVPASATCVGSATWPMIVAAAATNKRLLLKHDDTFTGAAGTTLTVTGPCMIGMYGSGAKPIIRNTGTADQSTMFSMSGTVSDIRFVDLDFDGESNVNRLVCNQGSTTLSDILFLRCTWHEIGGGAIFNESTTIPNGLVFQENTIQNVLGGGADSAGFGLFLLGSNVGVLGNFFDDSLAGDAEHMLRMNYLNVAAISCNTIQDVHDTKEMLSVRGFDASTPHYGMSGEAQATKHFVISDNLFNMNDVAGPGVNYTTDGGSPLTYIFDSVIERNRFIGAAGGPVAIHCIGKRATIRNNIGTVPSGQFYITLNSATGSAPAATEFHVYNNDAYTAGVADFIGVRILTGSNDHLVYNNLGWADTATPAVMVDNSGTGNTIDDNTTDGQLVATCPYADTTPADPAAGEFDPIAYALTGALATVPVYDDFNGVRRNYGNKAPVMVMGAVQP